MKPRASEDILGALHDAVAQDLLRRVLGGEATPAELNAAIKFLQNNGIEANIAGEDNPLAQLAASLPTFDDEIGEDGYVN
jgi:hypothetical protein